MFGGAPRFAEARQCPPQRPHSRHAICAPPKPRAFWAFPAARWKSTAPMEPGPRYSKLGGRVVYRLEDLQAWADRGVKASTSDPGVGTVLPARRQAAAGLSSPNSSRG